MNHTEEVVGYIGRPIKCATCGKTHRVRRPQATYGDTLSDQIKDAGQIVLGLVVLLILFLLLPVTLWLAMGAPQP